MNKILNMLLRSSISASMSNREAFTAKIAQTIENKVGTDSQAAQKMSDSLAAAMDSMNEQLLFDQIFSSESENKELEDKIERLTISIDRLNSNIEKLTENGNR